jgi:hypothetical protein
MRAFAGRGLSELLTRAAAAALAAATRALARISRPRSELTRLSSPFFSVDGTRKPSTLVEDRAVFLVDRVDARAFVPDGLGAGVPARRFFAPALVPDLTAFAIARSSFRWCSCRYQLRVRVAIPRAKGRSVRATSLPIGFGLCAAARRAMGRSASDAIVRSGSADRRLVRHQWPTVMISNPNSVLV